MFWQCIEILYIEDWSFPEFLLMVLGASVLFFATTGLPKFNSPENLGEFQKENQVLFCLMASFLSDISAYGTDLMFS